MPPSPAAGRSLDGGQAFPAPVVEAQSHVATHYEILGVPRSASTAEIRRAYHDEARRWHPDRIAASGTDSRRAEDAMRRVNEAWRVLGNAQRRREYDRAMEARIPGPTSAAAGGGATAGTSPRIDPRLLDPEYLAARRRAHDDEIVRGHAVVLRMAPWVAVLGLLVAIFVVTAYARPQESEPVAAPTTVAGPAIGVDAGACVRIASGPSLLAVPCDGVRDGYVIGVKTDPDQPCPALTVREVALPNGAIVCLAP
jgi:hypothetical protein